MTHHPLTKWKRPFSVAKTTKQPVLTTSLLRSLSKVGELYTEGSIILSLTAGPLNVSHSNGKMTKLFSYTSKRVTEQNVATVVASPISVAGKELAKIMLTRLLEHVVDLVLPESQCGFRHGRSTIDMIFGARQLQEKCCEQHQDLYMAFADLTKVFDTVNRYLLWNIMCKFGCPPTFIDILQQFHTGMCGQVVMAGSQSSSFPVEVGVKQGCVLAPIIFNLLLVATTLVSHRDLQSSDCVGIEYRLDGDLFNL